MRYLSEIAYEIRRVRTESGLTQDALARRCGITPTYLSKLEHGHKWPSIELLVRIAFRTERRIYLTLPPVRHHA